MNASEREKLSILIESLQGRVKHPVLTTVELVEVIGYLRALQYLAPRLASDWEAVKRMEQANQLCAERWGGDR